MKKVASILLGSSPKTSFVGLSEGAVTMAIPKDFTLSRDWPYLVVALLMYLKGRLSTDSNRTLKQKVESLISQPIN